MGLGAIAVRLVLNYHRIESATYFLFYLSLDWCLPGGPGAVVCMHRCSSHLGRRIRDGLFNNPWPLRLSQSCELEAVPLVGSWDSVLHPRKVPTPTVVDRQSSFISIVLRRTRSCFRLNQVPMPLGRMDARVSINRAGVPRRLNHTRICASGLCITSFYEGHMSKNILERRAPATRTDRSSDPGKHRP